MYVGVDLRVFFCLGRFDPQFKILQWDAFLPEDSHNITAGTTAKREQDEFLRTGCGVASAEIPGTVHHDPVTRISLCQKRNTVNVLHNCLFCRHARPLVKSEWIAARI